MNQPAQGADDIPDPPAAEPLEWGEMQEAMARRPASPADAVYRYGDGPHRFAELRLPDGAGPFPVAAVIHGGCWLSIADLTYMHAFSEAMVDMGWAVWSLEFNRIDQPEGAWPGILEDVAAGVDHLRAAAAEHPLDLNRVVAMGHSSGGHLALWAAGRAGLPEDAPFGPALRDPSPLPLAGVVGLAPIADLRDYTGYTRCGSTAVQDFLGSDDLEGDRMAASDPAALIPSALPQLLLFGELDPIVPPAHGRAYLARRRALQGTSAGDRGGPSAGGGERSSGGDGGVDAPGVRYRVISGAGHFELVAPFTRAWEGAAGEIDRFLRGLGGIQP